MSRQIVWIEQQRFAGWGCSECSWLFHMPDFPKGPSLEEMKQRVEEQRDQEFARHVCAAHPKSKATAAR
jgi:hypothetical protein